jgi:Galactose oxidase-like, Early set domain/Carboxypeptidase regulatory-like domain/Glyoxal oxidase N-terminus
MLLDSSLKRALIAWRNPLKYVLVVLFLLSSAAVAQTPDVVGQWSSLMSWPCANSAWVPTHAMLMPNGKVFYFSSYGDGAQPRIWDPATNGVSLGAAPGYNVFCAGHSALANGNLLITGGHIADYVGYPRTSIYNPFTGTWTRVADMNAGRWYPTNTTLGNGDVLVVSGNTTSNGAFNKVPQVFQAGSNTWRTLSAAVLQQPLYPYMYLAPNGKVFNAGTAPQTRYLNPSGAGAWEPVLSTTRYGKFRDYGSSVMYLPGKILIVGGGGDWHAGADPQPTATAEVIDLNSATPAWQFVASMNFRRRQNNATLLPDGKVLVTGGTSSGGPTAFDDPTLAVRAAEIWDPATNVWTVLSSNTVYRGYHSFALLLPDGRVLSAGGQIAGCTAEIFSPPYLFKGARPTISGLSFSSVNFGQTQFVPTPDVNSIAKVSWIRLGSVTHTFNQDQRFVPLTFSKVAGGLNVTFPANGNVSPPGYYMLFILNSNGVPSIAKILRISAASGAGTGTITGKVTNISNGQALSGATVSYSGGSTTTNTSGIYTLGGVAGGTYNVTAARTGYLSRTLQTTVSSGGTSTLNFQIATAGIIAGKVTNSSGAGIAGASVKITGGVVATSTTVTTNSTGNYSSSWIPVGTNYSVTASQTGFTSKTVSPVTVNSGATTTVNFTLQ